MRPIRLAILGLLGVGLAGAACSENYGSGGGCTNASAPDVNIKNTAFCPAARTITAGTSVTWTNLDGITHTSTSDASSTETWNSTNIAGSGTFSHTFNTPGTYAYHCNFHSSMHGTIVVN